MSIFNVNQYLILNGALVFAYCFTKLILFLPILREKLSQQQRLSFIRKIFITMLCVFSTAHVFIAALALDQDQTLQFQPIIKEASAHFLAQHTAIVYQVEELQSSASWLTLNAVLPFMICLGLGWLLFNYAKNMLALHRLTKQAYCQRKIKRIHILFSETTSVPLCWTNLYAHFVIIPSEFLTKRTDLKLAIRHELQHIRQGDTYWLHLMALLNVVFFWNPCIKLWRNWFNELQEFACDESLIVNQQLSAVEYAQCLIDTAASAISHSYQHWSGSIALTKHSPSILNRRVTMLFDYRKVKNQKVTLICAYATCFLAASSVAYAIDRNTEAQAVTASQLTRLVSKSHLQIAITPEVVAEINRVRSNEKTRMQFIVALERMKKYQPYITAQLQKNGLPNNLLALPLVESGYNPNAKSPIMHTAGIWQFIPSTANHFGMVVNDERDDRVNTQLSTQAAIAYLQALYAEFHDWRLAVIAYEIGEDQTEQLISKVGSRDPWVVARSSSAPASLNSFLASFDAAVVMMHNPDLVTKVS